jgi:hypothetical protein
MAIISPTIELGTAFTTGGGVTANGAVGLIGSDLSQVTAATGGVYQDGTSKLLHIQAGLISQAYFGQVGRVIDGVTITLDMVGQNQQLLNQLGQYCRANGIGIVVEAQLDLSPSESWNYQIVGNQDIKGPAVLAGLPIVAVEDDDEPEFLRSPTDVAQTAQNIASNVAQYTRYYPDIKVGQWVAGLPSNAAALWSAYNTVAQSQNLPSFSYAVADTAWNAPWRESSAQAMAWLANISTAAKVNGMNVHVLLDGTSTDMTGAAWTAQSEQKASILAQASIGNISDLLVEPWTYGVPSDVAPANAVGTVMSAATNIRAIYPLYQAGLITASSTTLRLGSAQANVRIDGSTPINMLSVIGSPADIASNARLAIVITDQTGQLAATASGSGTVSNQGVNTLVLDGSFSDINAELATIKVIEPVSGPDTLNIEVFGRDGRLANGQVYLVASQNAPGTGSQTMSFAPTTLGTTRSQPWTGAVVTYSGGKIVSETETWNTATLNPTTGASQIVKLDVAHLPLADAAVTIVNGVPINANADAVGANPISTPSTTWNASGFQADTQITQLLALTSTFVFSASTGALETITDTLGPLASATGRAAPSYLASGGVQVIYENTGDNPGWNPAWGAAFASTTLTYGSNHQLLEQVWVGNENNNYLTVDNVYDPSSGHLWEQMQSTQPPIGFTSFGSGFLNITQFNTGDNPNWDYVEWANAPQMTSVQQDYYAIAVSTQPPPPLITAVGQSTSFGNALWYAAPGQAGQIVSGLGGCGNTVAVAVNGTPIGTTSVDPSGLWSLSLASLIASGTYKLSVTQTVIGGTLSSTASGWLLVGSTFTGTAADTSAQFDDFQGLAAAGQLKHIVLTDSNTPTLSLTLAQVGLDRPALGLIAVPYNIGVTGVSANVVQNEIKQPNVTSVAVADTAVNVTANLGNLAILAAAGQLSSVILTDPVMPTLTLSSAQMVSVAPVLAVVANVYTLALSGLPGGQITGIVASVGIQSGGYVKVRLTQASATKNQSCDLVFAANGTLFQEFDGTPDGGYVLTQYDVTGTNPWSSFVQTVSGKNQLISLDYIMHSGQPYSRVVHAYGSNGAQSSETDYFWSGGSQTIYAATGNQLLVQDVSAALAGSFAHNTAVVSVTVIDSAAAVASAIGGLQSLAAVGRLGSIGLTDSGSPMLNLTSAQYGADQGALAKINSPYQLAITGTAVADRPTPPLQIAGTVGGQQTTDRVAISPFSGVTLTDSTAGQTHTVTVTLSGAANGTLSNLGAGRFNAGTGVYTVAGSAAAVTTALDGLIFAPTQHLIPVGQTFTTKFTITDSDTAGVALTDGTTTVTVTAVVIETAGGTSLLQAANQYFLQSGTGPNVSLQYNGAPVTVGEFGAWAPIAAEAITGGYEVAWKNASENQYVVWSTNSSGVYTNTIVPPVTATDPSLENIETSFQFDINGDGTIGLKTTTIETAGGTSLLQAANQYFLQSGTGPNVSLQYNGAPVTVGEFGAQAPIAAEAITGGYEVAWKNASENQYVVWSTNSSGVYTNTIVPPVTATNPSLENIETSFQFDINGDGTIGLKPDHVIETNGTTSLWLVDAGYVLAGTNGTSPILKYLNSPVNAGQFGAVAPIAAAQTATGYEVAWKITGANQYVVWNTDGNGNYTSSWTAVVSGQSFALEDLEPSFGFDLNGDGRLSTQLITTGPTVNLTGLSQAATINLGSDTASASAGLSGPSLTFIGTPNAITLGTGKSIVEYALQASSGIETVTNFALGTDLLNIDLGGAANSTLVAFDTTVGGNHAIVLASSADPSHGIVLLNFSAGLTAANLLVTHTNFTNGHALIS